VQCIGVSTIENKLCILTEFAELGSVASLMKTFVLEYPVKLKFALDAAQGLHFLHKNKIIHRDLKNDNLLVFSLSLDAPVNVKITDFGTSRALNAHCTRLTSFMGTPNYMSPEALRGDPSYGMPTDLYGFGLILFELYVQRAVYRDILTVLELEKFVTAGNREPIPEHCPDDYKNLIQTCWDSNPDNRPSSRKLVATLKQMFTTQQRENTRNFRSTGW